MWWVGYSDHRRAVGSSGLQFKKKILSTTCKLITQMLNPCWIQDRTVNHIVSHAEFNPRNLGNTIALLFVENNFELADHIDTICLPAYQVLSWLYHFGLVLYHHLGLQENFELSKGCYVKGWGKDVFGKEGEYQVISQKFALQWSLKSFNCHFY